MEAKIALLSGGQSSERAVALASAKNVYNILVAAYQVKIFDFPRDLKTFLGHYKKYRLVIPIFHGAGGEDGTIQGFLKILNCPFLFSDVSAQATALDKLQSKLLAEQVGLLTAPFVYLDKKYYPAYKNKVVVKPINGGSSIGISLANSHRELRSAINLAFHYSKGVIVEDYIKGKEFTVAIIDYKNKCRALPVIEVISKNKFFDYHSKYDPSLAQEICPAKISSTLAKKLQKQAMIIHRAIGARHISRSDFIVRANKIYFLEINTIPGLTKHSLVPKAIKAANLKILDVFKDWIKTST